jgi:diaminohydroxyphosphoribosylaminopyrimidine deaminase/5-amino-6-(5-phosphoribosylamino)uracil reductase
VSGFIINKNDETVGSSSDRQGKLMADSRDERFMRRCLELAELAVGRTSPNPLVGAVVLDSSGAVAGEGHHKAAGQPHAEVEALNQAGDRARGGTLYINLEPCCHYGRTPPCTDRIIASGIKRVVAGPMDPNPEVRGAGLQSLRDAGIDVVEGVLDQQCRLMNRAFFKFKTTGLPWVILKLASTLDAKIADHAGSSRWISGPEARHYVHELRNRCDCVMVGGATAVKDDPQLNVRDVENSRDPLRAVVDTDLLVSPEARICSEDSGGPTVIFCSNKAIQRRGKRYPDHVKLVGLETETLMSDKLMLSSVMQWLAAENIVTVLCEGGSRLSGGLLRKGLIDEVQWIIAPKILGDSDAIPAIAGVGRVRLDEAWQMYHVTIEQLGSEVLVRGLLRDVTE